MVDGKPSPERQLDPTALRAYAHPLRLRMMRYLADHGSATATELAKHLGESTGQTSYHLRQLARHGLIEDDPGRNRGRERWWRPTSFSVDARTLAEDPATRPAAAALMDAVVRGRAEAMQTWVAAALTAPSEWVDASVHSEGTMTLTAAELAELTADLTGVLSTWAERVGDRRDAPVAPGQERVRVYVDAFPITRDGTPHAPDPADAADTPQSGEKT